MLRLSRVCPRSSGLLIAPLPLRNPLITTPTTSGVFRRSYSTADTSSKQGTFLSIIQAWMRGELNADLQNSLESEVDATPKQVVLKESDRTKFDIAQVNAKLSTLAKEGKVTSLIDQLSSVHDPNLETFRIVFLTVSRYGDAMVAIEIIRKMRDLHILWDVPTARLALRTFFNAGKIPLALDFFGQVVHSAELLRKKKVYSYFFENHPMRSKLPTPVFLPKNFDLETVAADFALLIMQSSKRSEFHTRVAKNLVKELLSKKLPEDALRLALIASLKIMNFDISTDASRDKIMQLGSRLRPLLDKADSDTFFLGWKTFVEGMLVQGRPETALSELLAARGRGIFTPAYRNFLGDFLPIFTSALSSFQEFFSCQSLLQTLNQSHIPVPPRVYDLYILTFSRNVTVPTPEQVNTLIEDLLHRGVHVRSTAVFNAVLANLIRNKRGKEAKEYFDSFITRGVVFDAASLAILIHGASQSKDVRGIIDGTKLALSHSLLNAHIFATLFALFRRPESKRLSFTPSSTWTKAVSLPDADLELLIKSCFPDQYAGLGKVEETGLRQQLFFAALNAFESLHLVHDRVTAGVVLDVLVSLTLYKDAVKFYKKLDNSVPLDSNAMWNVILSAYRLHKSNLVVTLYDPLQANLHSKLVSANSVPNPKEVSAWAFRPITVEDVPPIFSPPVITSDLPLPTEGGLCIYLMCQSNLTLTWNALRDYVTYNYGKRHISTMPYNLFMRKALSSGNAGFLILALKLLRFASQTSRETIKKTYDIIVEAVTLLGYVRDLGHLDNEQRVGAEQGEKEDREKEKQKEKARQRENEVLKSLDRKRRQLVLKLRRDPFAEQCLAPLEEIRGIMQRTYEFH